MLNINRVVDEIALEGVDGITLECLFRRLRIINGDQESGFISNVFRFSAKTHK